MSDRCFSTTGVSCKGCVDYAVWCLLYVDCGGWSRWRMCGACAVRCLSFACAWICMCVFRVLVAWRLGSGSVPWLVVAPPWYVRGCLLAYRTNSVAVCINCIQYVLAWSVLYHHVIILVASAAASSDGLSRGPRVYGPNKHFWFWFWFWHISLYTDLHI